MQKENILFPRSDRITPKEDQVEKQERREKERFNRVFLVMPPAKGTVPGMPLGLASLVNYIEQNTSTEKDKAPAIEITDLSRADLSSSKPQEDFENLIGEITDGDLLGVTATTSTYQDALEVVRRVKQQKPGCKVVLGGPHIQCENPETILNNHPEVDYLAIGSDGEKTLLALINSPANLQAVPGLVYRKEDGKIELNMPETLSREELNSLGFAVKERWLSSIRGKLEDSNMPYVSSRGCIRKCPFCAVSESGLRAVTIERVIQDIKTLQEEYGKNYQKETAPKIDFEDNFFAVSPAKITKLCAEIRQAIRNGELKEFKWNCQTRVELADHPEAVKAMSKAGCEAIFLGVENLSPTGLAYRHNEKGENVPNIKDLGKLAPQQYIDKTRKMVEICFEQNINIDPVIMFQMGIPGEDKKVRQENLAELTRLGQLAKEKGKELTVYLMVTVLYPATPLFEEMKENYNLPDDIFEFWTKWEHENRDQFFSKNFPHGIGGIPISIVDLEALKDHRVVRKEEEYLRIITYMEEIKQIEGLRVPNIQDIVI